MRPQQGAAVVAVITVMMAPAILLSLWAAEAALLDPEVQNAVDRINAARQEVGTGTLNLDAGLASAARNHTADMAAENVVRSIFSNDNGRFSLVPA
jgi:uncharacterized protein YkwD